MCCKNSSAAYHRLLRNRLELADRDSHGRRAVIHAMDVDSRDPRPHGGDCEEKPDAIRLI